MKKFIVAVLDLCAFIGGAFFIISRLVFMPLNQLFEDDLYVADLDEKVIYREYTGILAPNQNKEKDTALA